MPNPVAYFMHRSPWWFHRFETLVNHFVELVVPFFLFLGRRMCILHGLLQILFQVRCSRVCFFKVTLSPGTEQGVLEGWTPLPGGRGVGWDQAGCAGTRSSHRLQNLQRGRGRAWQHRGPPEPTVSEQEQHPGERAQASGQELRLERIEMVQGGSVLALGWFALAWPLLARRWRFAPRAAGLVSVHTGGGDGSAQDSCRGSDPADGWGEYFQFPQKLIFIDIFHPLKGFFSIFNIEGLFTESQNHRIVGVGRDLCGSPSPIPCPSRVTQSRL